MPYPLLPLLLCACASSAPQDPAQRTADLQRARALLAQHQTDEALVITDRVLKRDPADREALVLAADGNIALFESGRSGRQYFLADAISHLERALELDADDPSSWSKLSDLKLEDGAFEAGRDAALQAARRWRNAGAAPARVGQAVLQAADNEMQMFVDARQAEIDDKEKVHDGTAELARNVLARLAAAKQLVPGPAYLKSGQVLQWLGRELEALDEFERGLQVAPDYAPLHSAFQSIYFGQGRYAECVAAYHRLQKDAPEQDLLLWFGGRAEVALADQQRRGGDTEAADQSYAKATETFERYLARHPEHAAATSHWLAICHLSRGRLAVDGGDCEAARKQYAAAYDANPKVAEYDDSGRPLIYDSFNGSYLGGLDRIGRALVESAAPDALAKGLEHYDWVLQRHPDRFGSMYNNAALTARDLGAQIERAAERDGVAPAQQESELKRAHGLYEKSYRYYCKAVELSGDDARVVNDCGLMLVYHLHRDYDRARELFDRAIALGKEQLDALPEDTDAARRKDLEEAVGDAYQNIAVLLREEGKPFADYEPFLHDAVKYFPYSLREAQRLLANQGKGAAGPTPVAAAAAAAPQGLDDVRARAKAKADKGDYDGALLVLDEKTHQLSGNAEYQYLVGSYSLSYGRQAVQNGGSQAQIDGLLADAVNHLTKSVELDSAPLRPRLELAQAYRERRDFANAEQVADRLLAHIRSNGGADDALLAGVHGVRAEAAARLYITAKQGGKDDQEALRRARGSFREVEKLGRLDEKQIQVWTSLEQWAGSTDAALDIFVRGLEHSPQSLYLLDRTVETAKAAGKPERAVELLAGRDDAVGVWYRGKARFYTASGQWAGGDAKAAVATFDSAIADFRTAVEKNSDYAGSTAPWIAFCLGKKGLVQLSQDDAEGAEKSLLAAAKASPGQAEADLGGGSTIKRGLLILADHYFQKHDLANTERVYRAAGEVLPDDSDIANNHGLMARDYGTQLDRQGDHDRAAALYEASYAAYTRASKLEPDSVRLLNDRALLLLYHLRRDTDLALKLLQTAIEKGLAQLQDDPPSDATELRNLQEAVGDCYQNVGWYQEKFAHDLKAAQAAYQKSLTYYPFARRESSVHLRRVERALGEAAGGDHGK